MAAVVFFHYIPGKTYLHTMNLLPKLFSFLLLTSVIFLAQFSVVPLLLVGVFLLSFSIGENPFLLCWRLRLYLPFFIFLFLFDIYAPSGKADLFLFFDVARLPVAGILIARYLCALILAHLLLRTSSYRAWRDGLFSLFKPISIRFADTLSLAVTMSLHFIPLFMDEAQQILEALKVRSGKAKSPIFRRLRFLGLPLLVQVLLHADQTAIALESRGYTPAQTREKAKVCPADFIVMSIALASLCIILILNH